MQFERLKTSLANVSAEEPSIFLAVCLMESIVEDMEAESGREFSACMLGAEALSSKLLWLCRTAKTVYLDNRDSFGRSREKLEKAAAELTQIEETLKSNEAAEDQLIAVQQKKQILQQELISANEKKVRAEALAEQNRKLEAELHRLDQFDEQAEIEKAKKLDSEIQERNRSIGAFQAAEIEPRKNRLASAQTELTSKKAERDALEIQIRDLEEERVRLVHEIAQSKETLDHRHAALGQKQSEQGYILQQLQSAQEKIQDLEDQLRTETEHLDKLQSRASILQTEDLPQKQHMVAEEYSRVNELEKQLLSFDEQEQQLQKDIRKLEEQCTEKTRDLQLSYDAYETLTSDYHRKSKELSDLDRQLADLKGKTDEERHETYKQQLQKKIAALDQIRRETEAMEQRNRELDVAIEQTQAQLSDLRASQEQKADTEKRTTARIRELRQIVTPEYVEQIKQSSDRLAQLEQAWDALLKTLFRLQKEMDIPVDREELIPASSEETLRRLKHYTDNCRQRLISCADLVSNSLRWETY